MSDRPLSGVAVVDLCGLLPGPWCSLMLWQLGADVTWVQRPGGDPLRTVDPGPYVCLARGKTIVEIDLKEHPGQVPIAAAALKVGETRIAAAAAHESPSKKALMSRGAYGVFSCADGGWLSIACIEEHFWRDLCRALGLGHLLADERFSSYRGRCDHAPELNARIAAALSERPLAAWLSELSAADVPVAAVIEPWELAGEPQVAHLGLLSSDDGVPGVGLPYTGLEVRDAG